MNAPAPSFRPAAAPSTQSTVHAPALVPVSRDISAAANDDTERIEDTERIGSRGAVNPLWMITAALGFFLVAMAVLISS
jgi:hypothetical protein